MTDGALLSPGYLLLWVVVGLLLGCLEKSAKEKKAWSWMHWRTKVSSCNGGPSLAGAELSFQRHPSLNLVPCSCSKRLLHILTGKPLVSQSRHSALGMFVKKKKNLGGNFVLTTCAASIVMLTYVRRGKGVRNDS